MAQEDQPNREPRCIVRAGRCVVHGLTVDDAPAATELVQLRRRVAELEASLAAAEARASSPSVAPAVTPVNGSATHTTAVNGAANGVFAPEERGTNQPAPTAMAAPQLNGSNGTNGTINGVANGAAMNGSDPTTHRSANGSNNGAEARNGSSDGVRFSALPRVPVADPVARTHPIPATPARPQAVTAIPATTESIAEPRPEPDEAEPDFSHAWGDADASFEERIAAKAFFREEAIDEPSRRWFLEQS